MSDEAPTADPSSPDLLPAETGGAEASGPAEASVAPAHGGVLLREAREAAGIHIAALAVALKVPVRQIEALEQGAFERLPDPTFARALASSLCRQLRIDPKPILDRLPPARLSKPRISDGINEPFHRPGTSAAAAASRAALRPPVLVAAVLLLAALALLAWPWIEEQLGGAQSQVVPAAASPAAAPALEPMPPGSVPAAGLSGVVVEPVQPALPLPGAVPVAPTTPAIPSPIGRNP